ncbi:DUF596 domain-containing protein [Pectobacterium atrosepticum]|uniref:DUF596 domain-containing protein n=1 Tax=Pectobacterium atrosepticum TaxID=29471 RepID=UPI00049A59E3|nr:DUF596 domain-containing protein [Pectobacterium atrosepticum]GKV87426.1 hypothetical protein PEC301296_37370 [Pectobacterium carotovorum subsp. carotovorum]AIA69138.1 hypothetical protein EV46_00620 [Pectobacterium atrosepticum]AIK12044.1 hypothetical protein GZ59_01270 [Pectobacterium atrosepticum]KFX13590.1 hypothetical protein JV34_14725 [Pectobacterium atrosepticum]KMK83475.1 hypothetical protein KCQ_06822 [Pectobacterium atrosepticum ICMP 1526]
MNDNDIFDAVTTSAYGLSMGAIWQHIAVECRENPRTYTQRQTLFFDLLEHLIVAGKIRLASKGEYLRGEPKYQIDQLREAFPSDVSDDEFDDVDEFGLWFFAKAPAGVVWITPEGQEIWT